jgi:hypothetical protein
MLGLGQYIVINENCFQSQQPSSRNFACLLKPSVKLAVETIGESGTPQNLALRVKFTRIARI